MTAIQIDRCWCGRAAKFLAAVPHCGREGCVVEQLQLAAASKLKPKARYRVEFSRWEEIDPWHWAVYKRGDTIAVSRSILKEEAELICRLLNAQKGTR